MQPSNLPQQLAQSMQQGGSPLDQVSQASPNFQPGMQAPPPAPMPDKSPATMMHLHEAHKRRGLPIPAQLMAQGAQQLPPANTNGMVTLPIQDQNPQTPGVQVPLTEAELIVKALSKRLEHHSKHTDKVRDAVLGSQGQVDDWDQSVDIHRQGLGSPEDRQAAHKTIMETAREHLTPEQINAMYDNTNGIIDLVQKKLASKGL